MPTPEPLSPLKVNGLTVHDLRWGVGQKGRLPVLMLHGWGANIDLVRPLAEPLARKGHLVYALDLPGFGQTPPPPLAWTIYDYVAFVLAYLQARDLERVHIFGHSFGGRLGLILGAVHHPQIGRMVLANSAGIRPGSNPWVNARLNTYKALRDGLRRVGLPALSERLRVAYNARYGSPDFNAAGGVMRGTFVNVVNEDLLPYAAQVRVPVLLIWGDQDKDTPLAQGQKLEQTIPDAGLVVYEGAGHYSYLDRLNEAVQVCDYFFAGE